MLSSTHDCVFVAFKSRSWHSHYKSPGITLRKSLQPKADLHTRTSQENSTTKSYLIRQHCRVQTHLFTVWHPPQPLLPRTQCSRIRDYSASMHRLRVQSMLKIPEQQRPHHINRSYSCHSTTTCTHSKRRPEQLTMKRNSVFLKSVHHIPCKTLKTCSVYTLSREFKRGLLV